LVNIEDLNFIILHFKVSSLPFSLVSYLFVLLLNMRLSCVLHVNRGFDRWCRWYDSSM